MQALSPFTTKNKLINSSLNQTRPSVKPATPFQGATSDVFQKRNSATTQGSQAIHFSGKKKDKFISNALDVTQGVISGFAKEVGTSALTKVTGGNRKLAEAIYEKGMSSLDKKPKHQSSSSSQPSSHHNSSRHHDSSRQPDSPKRKESSRQHDSSKRHESSHYYESSSRYYSSRR